MRLLRSLLDSFGFSVTAIFTIGTKYFDFTGDFFLIVLLVLSLGSSVPGPASYPDNPLQMNSGNLGPPQGHPVVLVLLLWRWQQDR